MRLLLIGHRGTGKTGLLARIGAYRPGATLLDLDQEIERRHGMTIDRIFEERGEAVFRRMEQELLDQLAEHPGELVVAAGAGYSGPVPAGWRCLWVRRDSDASGRIFLDRPRLEPGLGPLADYLERFERREQGYRARADRVLTLREGWTEPSPAEAAWFQGTFQGLGGVLTVLPENLADLETWLEERLAWGVDLFELRDDLLGPNALDRLLNSLPPERALYARRRPGGPRREPSCRRDWDLDLGPCPAAWSDIVSLHARRAGETLLGAGRRLAEAGTGARLLKLAVAVETFGELEEGHRWSREEPRRRVFLPRSASGRWAWYRLLLGRSAALNFFREGAGSAPDQPLLLDWAERKEPVERFAAVLGEPVAHSRTPAEQAPWFRRYGMPVYAVALSAEEWQAGALEFLRSLGLRAAAVTAPHKRLAWAAANLRIGADQGAVNTLCWDEAGGRWIGTSTDGRGFALALAEAGPWKRVAIWGGGGTLAMLRAALPEAGCFASRAGLLQAGPAVEAPDLVVWATGRPGASPPASWAPATVLDLSYREDSPARAYALAVGARYLSGLAMFREQARLQRLFWQEHLR